MFSNKFFAFVFLAILLSGCTVFPEQKQDTPLTLGEQVKAKIESVEKLTVEEIRKKAEQEQSQSNAFENVAGVQIIAANDLISWAAGVQEETGDEFPIISVDQGIPQQEQNAMQQRLWEIYTVISDLSGVEEQSQVKIQYVNSDGTIVEAEKKFSPEKKISLLSSSVIVEAPSGDQYFDASAQLFNNPADYENGVNVYEQVNTGCKKVKKTQDVPLFSQPQMINVLVLLDEETAMVFGIIVDPKAEQPIVALEKPVDNPSLVVYADSITVSSIFSSPDPMLAFGQALSSNSIVVDSESLGTQAQIKLLESNVSAVLEKQGLVSEKDCDEARRKWLQLKKMLDSLDCSKIAQQLERAREKVSFLEQSLAGAQKNVEAKKARLEKEKKWFKDFLESILGDDTHSFSPPSDPENWNRVGYPRHGTDIHFKGDGQKIIDKYQQWEKEINEYRQAIEKAIAELEAAEATASALFQELEAARQEAERLQEKLGDCLARKTELEKQIAALENAFRECLEKLGKQYELSRKAEGVARETVFVDEFLDRSLTLVKQFEELDRQIGSAIYGIDESKVDCSQYKELQAQAKYLFGEAASQRNLASRLYNEAKKAFDAGKLDDAEILLKEAEKSFNGAREKAREAEEISRQAIAEKRNCLSSISSLQQDKEEQEEKEQAIEERVREAKEIVGKPYYADEDFIRVTLYREFTELMYGHIADGKACDCTFKSLVAARSIVGEVFGELIYELGLGVIKAPIDALSPEGRLGKIAQKIVSYTLTALGSDSISDFAKEVITSELVEKIVGKMELDLAEKPAEVATGETAAKIRDDAINEIFKKNKVAVYTYEKQGRINSLLCGQFECNIKMVVFYNPGTRYIVAVIKPGCCPETIVVSLQLDEQGVPESETEMKIVR